ncbi:MAG: serine/threonine-protein kinase [Kofleriaceae bacterium]
MGVVYAVKHSRIGKRAALKVLQRRLTDIQLNAERMLLEAQVVNAIGHPGIVDIFDVGATDDGRPYIVMEYLAGRSLAEHEPDVDESLAILGQVCDALIAAHEAGVVHRDLKPENIFLVETGGDVPRVKLLDWGIARMLHAETRHTFEGQVVGTPRYLAPEQARGEPVTAKTDVYSLGVVAYELLLLQPPFVGTNSTELLAMHLLVEPRPPRELWADIPDHLDRLLRGMLAKAPAARPTMREVAAQLARGRNVVLRPTGDAAGADPGTDPGRSSRTRRLRTDSDGK